MKTSLRRLPENIASQSISEDELVLPYGAALEAIAELEAQAVRILGWEGWLRYPDGSVGHSARFQGTAAHDFGVQEAATFMRRTIQKSQAEWEANPELPGGALHYCITF